ncbi:hypothetical protein D3C81_1111500 [compost metagenome]
MRCVAWTSFPYPIATATTKWPWSPKARGPTAICSQAAWPRPSASARTFSPARLLPMGTGRSVPTLVPRRWPRSTARRIASTRPAKSSPTASACCNGRCPTPCCARRCAGPGWICCRNRRTPRWPSSNARSGTSATWARTARSPTAWPSRCASCSPRAGPARSATVSSACRPWRRTTRVRAASRQRFRCWQR